MKQPKSISVYLKEGRHATQPWTFVIDRPGAPNKETKSERYSRLFTAKRGALRMIGARKSSYGPYYIYSTGKVAPVTFYVIRRKKTKA